MYYILANILLDIRHISDRKKIKKRMRKRIIYKKIESQLNDDQSQDICYKFSYLNISHNFKFEKEDMMHERL